MSSGSEVQGEDRTARKISYIK